MTQKEIHDVFGVRQFSSLFCRGKGEAGYLGEDGIRSVHTFVALLGQINTGAGFHFENWLKAGRPLPLRTYSGDPAACPVLPLPTPSGPDYRLQLLSGVCVCMEPGANLRVLQIKPGINLRQHLLLVELLSLSFESDTDHTTIPNPRTSQSGRHAASVLFLDLLLLEKLIRWFSPFPLLALKARLP